MNCLTWAGVFSELSIFILRFEKGADSKEQCLHLIGVFFKTLWFFEPFFVW